MSAQSNPDVIHEEIGHDDYSLSRVPESERYSWVTVAVQRFGQLSALSQFLLGATLGFSMTFWAAFLAITLGAVILEIVAILTGIAGQREGLSTSVLARWTGFGRYGSGLIGLVVAVSLIGWFGVQNAVFAEGVHSLVGGLPISVWSVITGLAVTSMGLAIGEAVLGAHRSGVHPVEAVCAATGDTIYGRGIPLFEGKVADVERRTREGFAVGRAILQGLGFDEGSTLEVRFQNENLVAILDGEPVASVPDLICLLDSERATAVTTERLRYGQRVTAIGIPTPEIMRSEEALEVWGPRAFGYEDLDFIPLERRFADYYSRHGVPVEKEKYLDLSSKP